MFYLSFTFFIPMSQTISIINKVACSISYTHQTSGECAGICACYCTHQMEKTASSKHSSKSIKSSTSAKEKAMQEKLEVAELLSEATFLEKKKTAQHQANESQVQEELAKARALLEIFDAEEANMHIETPRRMLTFDNGKSAIKADMNTFDQDVLKDKQYF